MTIEVSANYRGSDECPVRQWLYQEMVRNYRMSIEMSFGSPCWEMGCGDASPVGGRNEDLEKLYQNGLFGDQGDPKRRPILEELRRRNLT